MGAPSLARCGATARAKQHARAKRLRAKRLRAQNRVSLFAISFFFYGGDDEYGMGLGAWRT